LDKLDSPYLYLHPIHMVHDLVTTFLSISTEVVDFMPVHI
jgi:hypothetical protein